MGKQRSGVRGQESVCTIDCTFKLCEVTGKMFFRASKACGTIEDTHFSLDATVAGGHQIITIGERVFMLTIEEIIIKTYSAIHATPPTPTEGCWISVEDQMPDDDIEVLVYSKEFDRFNLAHHDDSDWISDAGDLLIAISHWMEPVPPETSSLQPQA